MCENVLIVLKFSELLPNVHLRDLILHLMLSGRVRYKVASFWNRNHALRALQLAMKNFQDTLEDRKNVRGTLLNY